MQDKSQARLGEMMCSVLILRQSGGLNSGKREGYGRHGKGLGGLNVQFVKNSLQRVTMVCNETPCPSLAKNIVS